MVVKCLPKGRQRRQVPRNSRLANNPAGILIDRRVSCCRLLLGTTATSSLPLPPRRLKILASERATAMLFDPCARRRIVAAALAAACAASSLTAAPALAHRVKRHRVSRDETRSQSMGALASRSLLWRRG